MCVRFVYCSVFLCFCWTCLGQSWSVSLYIYIYMPNKAACSSLHPSSYDILWSLDGLLIAKASKPWDVWKKTPWPRRASPGRFTVLHSLCVSRPWWRSSRARTCRPPGDLDRRPGQPGVAGSRPGGCPGPEHTWNSYLHWDHGVHVPP